VTVTPLLFFAVLALDDFYELFAQDFLISTYSFFDQELAEFFSFSMTWSLLSKVAPLVRTSETGCMSSSGFF